MKALVLVILTMSVSLMASEPIKIRELVNSNLELKLSVSSVENFEAALEIYNCYNELREEKMGYTKEAELPPLTNAIRSQCNLSTYGGSVYSESGINNIVFANEKGVLFVQIIPSDESKDYFDDLPTVTEGEKLSVEQAVFSKSRENIVLRLKNKSWSLKIFNDLKYNDNTTNFIMRTLDDLKLVLKNSFSMTW